MLDNQLIRLIFSVLNAGKAGVGLSTLPIKQSNQPTLQGANSQPTAYLFKVGPDKPYGFTARKDTYDTLNNMIHTETQQYESMFRLTAWATQDPKTPDALTASDIVNLLAGVLRSSVSIATFQAQGVGLLKPSQAVNPYFKDDHNQFQASPSFDFTLTHKQVIVSTTPIINAADFQILPV